MINPIQTPNPVPSSTPVPGVPPVAPVQPTAPAQPVAPVQPTVPVQPMTPELPTPVNPIINPTDPLAMPEMAPAPDPIEKELASPMKAADPVPGSIGSVISGVESSTPSVSFTDPAMQPDANPTSEIAKPAKKKTSKTTLIALIIVAFMVIIALAAILVMQLMN